MSLVDGMVLLTLLATNVLPLFSPSGNCPTAATFLHQMQLARGLYTLLSYPQKMLTLLDVSFINLFHKMS